MHRIHIWELKWAILNTLNCHAKIQIVSNTFGERADQHITSIVERVHISKMRAGACILVVSVNINQSNVAHSVSVTKAVKEGGSPYRRFGRMAGVVGVRPYPVTKFVSPNYASWTLRSIAAGMDCIVRGHRYWTQLLLRRCWCSAHNCRPPGFSDMCRRSWCRVQQLFSAFP